MVIRQAWLVVAVVLLLVAALLFFQFKSVLSKLVQIERKNAELIKKIGEINDDIRVVQDAVREVDDKIRDVKKKQVDLENRVKKLSPAQQVGEINSMIGGGVQLGQGGAVFSLSALNETYYRLKDRELLQDLVQKLEFKNMLLQTELDLVYKKCAALEEVNRNLKKQLAGSVALGRKSSLTTLGVGLVLGFVLSKI